MLALESTEANQCEEKKLFTTLIELLSYEKIIFNGKNRISVYEKMAWNYSDSFNSIKQQNNKKI